MRNSSGFHGYAVSSIYPNMGDGISQTMQTIPDPDEIEALSGVEPEKTVQAPVKKETKKQIWIIFAALVALVFLFGMPRG